MAASGVIREASVGRNPTKLQQLAAPENSSGISGSHIIPVRIAGLSRPDFEAIVNMFAQGRTKA